MTYPATGATGVETLTPFAWTTPLGAIGYRLTIGSTPGAADLFNSGALTGTSCTVPDLPPGVVLYGQISAQFAFGNLTSSSQFTFTALPGPARVITPANGSTNVPLSQPITWTVSSGAQSYYLYVGTTPGAKDVIDSGETAATSWSFAPSVVPGMFYIRMYTKTAGRWRYVDSSFTAYAPPSTMTYPTDGATAVECRTPFTWVSKPGASSYRLMVGSLPGGSDLFDTGTTTSLSAQAPDLPWTGPVYGTLIVTYRGISATTAFSFTALPPIARLTNPANGALNADLTVPLTWTVSPNAQSYYLYVGTAVGKNDVINTGEITSTSWSARSSIPAGSYFARLFTKTNGHWRSIDSAFTAASLPAHMTYPLPGATGVDCLTPFTWSIGVGAQTYRLTIGSAPGGNDLVDSGEIVAFSYHVPDLPAGPTLYGTLSTRMASGVTASSFTFTALPPPARLISPANLATGVDPTLPIFWSAATGAQGYYLTVGTTVGARDVLNTGQILGQSWKGGTGVNGGHYYARIYTLANGRWRSTDTEYTAIDVAPALLSPTDGSSSVLQPTVFTWTLLKSATSYRLQLGSSPGGNDCFDSGATTATSVTACDLPSGIQLYGTIQATTASGILSRTFLITVAVAPARLSYPADGSSVIDMSTPFSWNAVPTASSYYLKVGSSQGASNYFDSGVIAGSATTSILVPNVQPGLCYVRLMTMIGGQWCYRDTTFTKVATPHVAYPSDGTTNFDPDQGFTWTTLPDVTKQELVVGTTPGGSDLLSTGYTTQTSCEAPDDLPSGVALYARLWSLRNGIWYFNDIRFGIDYTVSPTFLAPVNGGQTDLSYPFSWQPEPLADGYHLVITDPSGVTLSDSGTIITTDQFLHGLPIGETLTASLSELVQGVWYSTSISFTPSCDGVNHQAIIDALFRCAQIVRQMADDDDLTFTYSPLGRIFGETRQYTVCSDFTTQFLRNVPNLKTGWSFKTLNVCFMANGFDCHTLVQGSDPIEGHDFMIDPTFLASVRSTSTQELISPDEFSADIRTMDFSAFSIVSLDPKTEFYIETYYIDYPLLFLDIYTDNRAGFRQPIASPLPYLVEVPLSSNATTYATTIGTSTGSTITVNIMGGQLTFPLYQDELSQLFYGASLSKPASESRPLHRYRPAHQTELAVPSGSG
jgi:hypothetical protein